MAMSDETQRVLTDLAKEIARWQDLAQRKAQEEPDMRAYYHGIATGYHHVLTLIGEGLPADNTDGVAVL